MKYLSMIQSTRFFHMLQLLSSTVSISYVSTNLDGNLKLNCIFLFAQVAVCVPQVVLLVKNVQVNWFTFAVSLLQLIVTTEVGVQTGEFVIALEINTIAFMICIYLGTQIKERATFGIACIGYTSIRILDVGYENKIFFAILHLLELTFIILTSSTQQVSEEIYKLVPQGQSYQQAIIIPPGTQNNNLLKPSPNTFPEMNINSEREEIINTVRNQEVEHLHTLCFSALETLPLGFAIIQDTPNVESEQRCHLVPYSNKAIRQMFGVGTSQQLAQELENMDRFTLTEAQNSTIKYKSDSRQFREMFLNQQGQYKSIRFSQSQVPIPTVLLQEDLLVQDSIVQFSEYLNQFWKYLNEKKPTLTEELGTFQFDRQPEGSQGSIGYQEYVSLEIIILGTFLNMQSTLIVQASDISHRKQITKLKEQNDTKQKTLSFVSHEYRTPLDCIIRNLEEYLSLSAIKNQFVKASLDNARYLLSLSNDLLDMAMIKVGKFSIKCEEFSLLEIIKSSLEMFELQAVKKSIQLRYEYDPNVPKCIVSDSKRIKQIIINLVGNAFKFTSQGSITLKVKQWTQNCLQILVEDTGLGIRQEDQPRLMQAFAKCSDKENQKLNPQGIGLGLVISNQIAALLSYDNKIGLQFHSDFKIGSQFWFFVSFEESGEEEQLVEQTDNNEIILPIDKINRLQIETALPKFLEQKKMPKCDCLDILIVDDSIFNIDIALLLLKRLKIVRVDQAISGFLAEEKVLKSLKDQCNDTQCKGYKLIFMDISMPMQDGYTTARNLRQLYRQYQIDVPIVACSGYDDKEEKLNSIQSGMIDYLVKPIEFKKLTQIIQKYYK